MKQVAIVGYAHPSKDRAPFDNFEYDIWGLNYLYYRIPRKTLWFEMHDFNNHGVESVEPEKYREWLRTTNTPVMMQGKDSGIQSSIRYPIETITRFYGGYFYCSVDYMIALAIWQGYENIELYGIHCLKEYEFENKGIQYWLGVCRGKGIRFSLPEEAEILRPSFYGYKESRYDKISTRDYDSRN